MSAPQPMSRAERAGLKSVVHVQVELAGGQENCTNVVGRPISPKSHSRFSDWGNQHNDERYLPIDYAVDLDRWNGAPRIVRAMARLLGYRLKALPRPEPARTSAQALLAVIKEGSEALAASAPMLDQHRAHLISPAALDHLRQQIREMVEAGDAALALLEPQDDGESGQ